jgi:hypothetical protein
MQQQSYSRGRGNDGGSQLHFDILLLPIAPLAARSRPNIRSRPRSNPLISAGVSSRPPTLLAIAAPRRARSCGESRLRNRLSRVVTSYQNRMRGRLIRRRGSRRAESRAATAAGCQDSKHCRMDTAYRPRHTRKTCRRSTDGHHASRKPNRHPDSGCISCGDSCQDKLGVAEKGPARSAYWKLPTGSTVPAVADNRERYISNRSAEPTGPHH